MLYVSRHGDRGSELPALPTATVWRAGQEAEVTWQITANHGGGYQYRLCPGDQALTEVGHLKHTANKYTNN